MLTEEITRVVKFIRHMLSSFGFTSSEVYVSTRPKDSIAILPSGNRRPRPLRTPGRGAVALPDRRGRRRLSTAQDRLQDQGQHRPHLAVRTLQVDPNLPERFKLEYVASDGTRKRPHHAAPPPF